LNTATHAAQTAITTLKNELKDLKVTDRDSLRRVLILKHGSLTQAAESLELPFNRLNGAISGRESLLYVVDSIQSDLGLTNSQVLQLWPLLRTWPRKSRIVS